MSENIKRMLAERAALDQAREVDETERLFEEEDMARVRHFFNEGWDGPGWPPFSLLIIGHSSILTAVDPATRQLRPASVRSDRAIEYWQIMMGEARRRYRAGYYADPFTKTPKRRNDSSSSDGKEG